MDSSLLFWAGVFALTLFLLIKSADYFIAAAERLGLAFGIPSFVVGATIVALGTSLPELASSVAAALQNATDIVAGNVVGSNITNILLVGGFVSVLAPRLRFDFPISRLDLVFLVLTSAAMMLFCYDGLFTRFDALVCVGLLLSYVGLVVFGVVKNKAEADESRPKAEGKDFLLLVLGGIGVYLAATFNIEAIIKIAGILQIGEGYIALGAVALGTSLPELFVSYSAARQGRTGIAIGNIIGSNIFNVAAVMGITGVLSDILVPDYFKTTALPLFTLSTAVFVILLLMRQTNRWVGLVLLALYGYFLYQIFLTQLV